MLDVDRFFQRIDYKGSRRPALGTLAALQLAFIYRVPFENLDIHLGRRIELSADKFYRKIVEQGRGGFCYECNTLFHGLLQTLGFNVSFVAATMQLETAMNIEFEHMALVVRIDGNDYLVDVGNGQSCMQPMLIGGDEIVHFENIDYYLDNFEDRHALYFRTGDKGWTPRFSFTTTPRQLHQYERVCHLIQTAPESNFTRRKVVTIARPDGRVTLTERDLEIRKDEHLEKHTLQSNDEYKHALQKYFNIQLEAFPESW